MHLQIKNTCGTITTTYLLLHLEMHKATSSCDPLQLVNSSSVQIAHDKVIEVVVETEVASCQN